MLKVVANCDILKVIALSLQSSRTRTPFVFDLNTTHPAKSKMPVANIVTVLIVHVGLRELMSSPLI